MSGVGFASVCINGKGHQGSNGLSAYMSQVASLMSSKGNMCCMVTFSSLIIILSILYGSVPKGYISMLLTVLFSFPSLVFFTLSRLKSEILL